MSLFGTSALVAHVGSARRPAWRATDDRADRGRGHGEYRQHRHAASHGRSGGHRADLARRDRHRGARRRRVGARAAPQHASRRRGRRPSRRRTRRGPACGAPPTLVVVFAIVALEFALSFWLASYLHDSLGVQRGAAALLVSALYGANLLGRVAASRAARRLPDATVLATALAGALLGTPLLIAAQQPRPCRSWGSRSRGPASAHCSPDVLAARGQHTGASRHRGRGDPHHRRSGPARGSPGRGVVAQAVGCVRG